MGCAPPGRYGCALERLRGDWIMAMSDELARLHELHRSGALSDEEFATAKARVLATGDGASGPGAEAASAVNAVNAMRRPLADRWVGGVCAGLAATTGLATWAWRFLFVVLALWGGAGLLVYALLWIFVPSE